MYLQQLNLTNFRNYENVNIELGRGINIFYGNNAQGKTNILEGIYFLALTKSHRTNNDYELLKENKESFSVNGSLIKDDMTYKLKIQYMESDNTFRKIDTRVDGTWEKVLQEWKNPQNITRELIETLIDKIMIYEDSRIKITFKCMDEFDKLRSAINKREEEVA